MHRRGRSAMLGVALLMTAASCAGSSAGTSFDALGDEPGPGADPPPRIPTDARAVPRGTPDASPGSDGSASPNAIDAMPEPAEAGPDAEEDSPLAADAAPSPGAAAAALPFPHECRDSVEADTVAAFEDAVARAVPGRCILLAPGTYQSVNATLSAVGRPGAPVIIRPRDRFGSVTLVGSSLALQGEHGVVVGLRFDGGRMVTLDGRYNRVTRNEFFAIEQRAAVWYVGRDARIDHNDIHDMKPNLMLGAFGLRVEIDLPAVAPKRLLIDQNYLHDTVTQTSNGHEAIQIGSNAGDKAHTPEVRVEYNLIARWNAEGEVLSAKAQGVRTEGNTIVDSNGRWGSRGCAVDLNSDWIENGNQVRVLAKNSVARGLRLINTPFNVYGGDVTWDEGIRDPAGFPGAYARSENALLVGIVMDGRSIEVGVLPAGSLPALDTRVEACTRPNGSPLATGSGINLRTERGTMIRATTTEPFRPARKLSAADVGIRAMDRLTGDRGPPWL